MTALAANINVQIKGEGFVKSYLVADNVHIYKGAMVVVDSSGYARPARNTVTDLFVGIADDEFDNTIVGHAAGARDARGQPGVPVRSGILAKLLTSGAAQTQVGEQYYASDDQLLTTTQNNSPIGVCTEFESATKVWIWIPFLPIGIAPALQGNIVAIDGDVRIAAGNLRLGAVSAFATTEPTSAAVFKQGTAPVGAIATSGAIYTDGTVMKKIIAAGTASNIET